MAPLKDIKVVELGVMIAVPAATEMLAGFGASVIKVEDTRLGDELRSFGSRRGGMSAWFANTNAGKRSIAVDLATEEGKEIMWKLLAGADVFIQGFRAGVMSKLGFDYKRVAKKLPELVYCSSTGFGETGPYAELPAYDPVIQALSGWAGCQLVDDKPTLHKTMVSDKAAAMYNAQAILAALIQKERTGKGCFIEASMLASNIMYNWPDVMMQCSLLEEDSQHLPNLLTHYRLYECTDGFVTVAVGTDKQWQFFCEALDAPEHFADERLKTAQDRGANMLHFFDTQSSIIAKFDVASIVERLRKADVPVAPVHKPEEVQHDPQVQARGVVEERVHPVIGRHLCAVQPASMFGELLEPGPAPMQGEQTYEILAELGYTGKSMTELETAGIVMGRDK